MRSSFLTVMRNYKSYTALYFTLLVTTLLSSCTNLARPNFTEEVVELKGGQYRLDKTHSSLNFKLDHLGLSKIVGRFNEVDGSLEFDPDEPTGMKLTGVISASSIDINNKDLENTLQEADWLNTNSYPQIIFNSTSVTAVSNNQFNINGILSMRGTTKPVTLSAIFNGGADNLITRKYTIGFSATTKIRRSDYGMDAFSAFAGDMIDVELHGEFQRQ